MATLEEYKAITGHEPPEGETAATELGDGGCHGIYTGKDATHVVGRWKSYVEASEALGKLQRVSGFAYLLETNHHWVTTGGTTKCQRCGDERRSLTNHSGMEWPA